MWKWAHNSLAPKVGFLELFTINKKISHEISCKSGWEYGLTVRKKYGISSRQSLFMVELIELFSQLYIRRPWLSWNYLHIAHNALLAEVCHLPKMLLSLYYFMASMTQAIIHSGLSFLLLLFPFFVIAPLSCFKLFFYCMLIMFFSYLALYNTCTFLDTLTLIFCIQAPFPLHSLSLCWSICIAAMIWSILILHLVAPNYWHRKWPMWAWMHTFWWYFVREISLEVTDHCFLYVRQIPPHWWFRWTVQFTNSQR